MERRILSWGSPPKFIQQSTWPTPMSRMVWDVGAPPCPASRRPPSSATSPSQVTFLKRSAAARKPGWRLGVRVSDALGHLEAAQRVLVPHLGVLGLG